MRKLAVVASSFVMFAASLAIVPAAFGISGFDQAIAPCGTCGGKINGFTATNNIRGVRVDLTRSTLDWSLVTNGSASEAIEVQDTSGNDIKLGYVKTTGTATICGVSTSGAVKLWWQTTGSTLTDTCHVGQTISAGENHVLKIQRCPTDDWCIFLDGSGTASDNLGAGFPPTLDETKTRGITSATSAGLFVSSTYNDSGTPWSVTDTGSSGSPTWTNVRNADVDQTVFGSDWNMPTIQATASWKFTWDS